MIKIRNVYQVKVFFSYFFEGGRAKLKDLAISLTLALFSSPLLDRNASITSSRLKPCLTKLLIEASETSDEEVPPDEEDFPA